MNKKTLITIFISILIVIGLVLAINNTVKLKDSEWVCISQRCNEFVTGEDWANQNCKLGDGRQMICEFEIEGQKIRVPLSGIENLSAMKSCLEYQCDSEVIIRRKE